MDDHLLVAGEILVEAAALYVLELDHDRPRVRPLAELVEPDLSHDGVERVLMNVLSQPVVIDAAGSPDRLLQDLHGGIGKWRLVKARRTHACVLYLRLKF